MAGKNKQKLRSISKLPHAKTQRRRDKFYFFLAFLRLCVMFLLLTIIFSCRSQPAVPDKDTIQTIPLDRGGSVYVIANAKQARSIIDLMPIEELKDRETAQMLERTDFFTAALFPPDSGRRFQLAAWGNYPSFGAGFAFSFNRGWQRQNFRAGGTYWHSQISGLSLVISSRQAFVVSSLDNSPIEPKAAEPGIELPQGFSEFSRGSPFSCWIEDPAPMLRRILSGTGLPIQIPVQNLFFNLYPMEEGRYEAYIRMLFENSSQARGMSSILNLASGFMGNDNSTMSLLFFSNRPVINDNTLDIKTASLSDEDISLLLQMFTLY